MQSTLNAPIYKPKIITLPPSFKDHLSKSFYHRPLTPEHPPSPQLSTSSFITTTNNNNSSFNTIKTYKIDLSKRTIKPIHSLSHNNSTITTSSNTISKYSSSNNPNISAFVYSNQNKIQNLKHHKKSIQLNKLIQTTSQPTLQSKKKYPKFSLKTKLSKPSSNSKLNTTMLYNKDIALLKHMITKRKDDDSKHYTYRSTHLNSTFEKKQQSVSFTQRQNNWKKKVDKKKKELSDINRNKESCSCTFKPKINKGSCKNNNNNVNDNECGKKYVNNIEGCVVRRKEVLNGLDKNVKKKNKRNGSYQGKKNDKEGYANDVKDKLEKVKQFIEKEENSFWDEDCLS